MVWDLSLRVTNAINRKNIYTLLASVFRQLPDHTPIQGLPSLYLREVCRIYENNSDISLGVHLIQNYISLNSVIPLEKGQEKLAIDQKTIKQPYEHIYTNKSPQDVRRDVVSYYEEAGTLINADILNDPDYIGMELNFMAELCANEVLILSHDYSVDTIFEDVIIRLLQKEFLQNHIGHWVPSFADELINHAATDFFKGVGFLLKGYICQECSRFDLNCQFDNP